MAVELETFIASIVSLFFGFLLKLLIDHFVDDDGAPKKSKAARSEKSSQTQLPPSIGVATTPCADDQHVAFSIGTPKKSPSACNCGDRVVREAGNQTVATDCADVVVEWRQEESRRPLETLGRLLKGDDGARAMSDGELVDLVRAGEVRASQLEKLLGDEARAVAVRRRFLSSKLAGDALSSCLDELPFRHYDYSLVSNSCCENVLGVVPIPVGYVGPLRINGEAVFVPMATTEGCLVASTNRGCRAISDGAGVTAFVYKDGMTRAPVVRFPSAADTLALYQWLQKEAHFRILKQHFDSTSRYARLQRVSCRPAGRTAFLRFVALTGDAMGMNMVSKACEEALKVLQQFFPNMDVLSLSGNYCVDKKPAAVNWIEGRGKSVVAEAFVPAATVERVLKSTVDKLCQLNADKNHVGSALAGALGGCNAHSANVVTAVFLATGQDAAQTVSSSNCLTQLERTFDGHLYISCTMPCLEVGTVGGGTILPAQRACLQMLQCAGGNAERPGANAERLATVIASSVLAGELSLLAALTSGDLVCSHIRYNRSSVSLRGASGAPSTADPIDGRISLTGRLFNANSKHSRQLESCAKIL